MIFNIRHVANCIMIRQQKQNIIRNNNQLENVQIICHQYFKGEKMIVCNFHANKYEKPYTGPYTIIELSPQYGNVMIQKGPVSEGVNIRRVLPFIY